MNFKKALGLISCVLLIASCFAQGARGKAELKVGAGAITIDYGQPALKGRDMLAKLQIGDFWRMGNNMATVLATPADLTFGAVKIAKGSYSLWLKRSAEDKYALVFNSQTGQWGTQHDPAKDIAQVPLKIESLPSPVEILVIELKGAPKGGVFSMRWGSVALTADFQIAQ